MPGTTRARSRAAADFHAAGELHRRALPLLACGVLDEATRARLQRAAQDPWYGFDGVRECSVEDAIESVRERVAYHRLVRETREALLPPHDPERERAHIDEAFYAERETMVFHGAALSFHERALLTMSAPQALLGPEGELSYEPY